EPHRLPAHRRNPAAAGCRVGRPRSRVGPRDLFRGFSGRELLPGHGRRRFDRPHPVRQVPGGLGIRPERLDVAVALRPLRSPVRARQAGLTLIETLIGMTLLGVGLLALAPLFIGSVRTNASSNQLGNVNALAGEKLEELIGYPATDPRLAVTNGSNAAA